MCIFWICARAGQPGLNIPGANWEKGSLSVFTGACKKLDNGPNTSY